MPSLLHLLQPSQAGVGLKGLAQGTRTIIANAVVREAGAREGRGREKGEAEREEKRGKREKK